MIIRRFKFNFRRLGIFIVVGLVLVLVMNFNTRLEELSHLQNEEATVRFQATGVMITQAVLQTKVALATSPAAVDAYARAEAHMGKPGDKVIVVLPAPGSTPQASPTPTPAADFHTAWDVWMVFIFGK